MLVDTNFDNMTDMTNSMGVSDVKLKPIDQLFDDDKDNVILMPIADTPLAKSLIDNLASSPKSSSFNANENAEEATTSNNSNCNVSNCSNVKKEGVQASDEEDVIEDLSTSFVVMQINEKGSSYVREGSSTVRRSIRLRR